MNAILDENYSFEQLINNLCDNVSGNRHYLKKESGTGYMDLIQVLPGVDFVLAELSILEPLLVKWEFKDTKKRTFYLIHVESHNTETSKKLDFNLAEEGTSVISQNSHRHILWLPKIKYKIISVRFSMDWINSFDNKFTIPESATSFINGQSELFLLHVKKSSDIKQVINQMFKYKDLVNKTAQKVYLNSKIIELLLIMFHISFPVSLEKNTKNAVHIDDYNKIINFTDDFLANEIVPKKIEVVASQQGMSRSKFQRIFKQVKGQTYYSFVLDVRMVKAMELLLENKSVTEVSDLTGYSNISSFTHAFSNYYKMLPMDFKMG